MKLLGERAWSLPRWLDRRLPVLDAEGEAITHQLSLAQWPTPDALPGIHGEGLVAATDAAPLLEGIDLDLAPGSTLLLAGRAASRRALTLALTGRLALTAGNLKVLGLVQPQQSGQLRRRATFVDGASPDAVRALTEPVGDLAVIDDADRLTDAARAAVGRLVRDPRRHARPGRARTAAPRSACPPCWAGAARRPRWRRTPPLPVVLPPQRIDSPDAEGVLVTTGGAAHDSPEIRWSALIAALLVPVLLAGGLLWGVSGGDARVRQVRAAIVNLDEMVEVNGQMMPMGRQLAAELVDSDASRTSPGSSRRRPRRPRGWPTASTPPW